MPTNIPTRRPTPRNEPVSVGFLLAMFAVSCIAIFLSLAILKDSTAADVYAAPLPTQKPLTAPDHAAYWEAIGMSP
jgi:hypothetical protein